MNKPELIKLILEEKEKVNKLEKAIQKSKALSAEGSISCKMQHGELRFYLREAEKGVSRYLGAGNDKKIETLCSKAYAAKLIKAAEKENKQLSGCVEILQSAIDNKGYDSADIDEVYSHMHEGIRERVKSSKYTDDGFARQWQEEKYYNRWMKSDYSFETPRGEKVRSKSEWMIACMLAEAGVPYRYEEIVAVSPEFKLFFHPDFTVLNKRTRKVYYWEHFGRMDDPKYIEESFMPKMNDYYNFEFLPGEKLLMTFESKHHPLDTTQVKRLIENYLL